MTQGVEIGLLIIGFGGLTVIGSILGGAVLTVATKSDQRGETVLKIGVGLGMAVAFLGACISYVDLAINMIVPH